MFQPPEWARQHPQVVGALHLAQKGRHAAAQRLLRRAFGGLCRREAHAQAGEVALMLGDACLARGGTDAAHAWSVEARRVFDQGADRAGVVAGMVLSGAALIDADRLAEAEAELRPALALADAVADVRLKGAVLLSLARCALWQQKFDDARALTARVRGLSMTMAPQGAAVAERPDEGDGVAAGTWARAGHDVILPRGMETLAAEIDIRVALAQHDVGRAARTLSTECGVDPAIDAVNAGRLHACATLVHGASGMIAAANAACEAGLRSAKEARAPVLALEVRLAHAQALFDAGSLAGARAALARLGRRRRSGVPGLVRRALLDLSRRVEESDARQPIDVGPCGVRIEAAPVLRLLEISHDADDERRLLTAVCGVLRDALAAASVSVFSGAGAGFRAIASAGLRPCRGDRAERAVELNRPVVLDDGTCGAEAAVPVRSGRSAVAAIAVRWPSPGTPDAGACLALLSAAAAVIAPAVRAVVDELQPAAGAGDAFAEIAGISPCLAALRRDVARAASAPFPVLVQGESGTGKELIAKAIHAAGSRCGRRLCAVNCAALTDELFEAELFGHARGAFTGAAMERAGLFEDAHGGTLFFDEISELSPRGQAKLLRAIQEGEVRRIGENFQRRVDVRVVAATNRPLHDEVRAGRFRHDLLFRLDVVRIDVPPLRQRPEDIPILARRFWRDALQRTGGRAELAPATVAALARYDWPGNVRELQNVLAALAVHAPRQGRVGPGRLPAIILARAPGEMTTVKLDEARRQFDRRFVSAALVRAGGLCARAAVDLGLTRQGLAKLMARLEIAREAGMPDGRANGP